MDTYKILVEGYAHAGADDKHFYASPTTILISSNGLKVLVDPGADKLKLLGALEREGMQLEDINLIFITHWHPDHILNIRLFPDHELMDSGVVWRDTGEEVFPQEGAIRTSIPGTNIQVIPTPGHTADHASLLIDTVEGKVCFAQDVFWWVDGEQPEAPTIAQLIEMGDPFAADMEAQKQSRQKVLDIADWIVPGHGKKFKNPAK